MGAGIAPIQDQAPYVGVRVLGHDGRALASDTLSRYTTLKRHDRPMVYTHGGWKQPPSAQFPLSGLSALANRPIGPSSFLPVDIGICHGGEVAVEIELIYRFKQQLPRGLLGALSFSPAFFGL